MKRHAQSVGILLLSSCFMASPSAAQLRVEDGRPGVAQEIQRKFTSGCTFYADGNGQSASRRTIALTPAAHPGIGSLPAGNVREANVAELGDWSNSISAVRCDEGNGVSCVAALYSGRRFRNSDRQTPAAIVAGSQGLVNLDALGWSDRAASYRVWCSSRQLGKVRKLPPNLPRPRIGGKMP